MTVTVSETVSEIEPSMAPPLALSLICCWAPHFPAVLECSLFERRRLELLGPSPGP